MDWVTVKQKLTQLWKKYKYPIIVFGLGIGLLLIPDQDSTPKTKEAAVQTVQQLSMEERLEQILSQIQGAGKVSVMVTVSKGAYSQYLQDADTDADGSYKTDSVLITDGDRNQQPVLQQVLPETYQGVIVVCQGGANASVRLNIIEAVSRVTGLGTDKICVLKMK